MPTVTFRGYWPWQSLASKLPMSCCRWMRLTQISCLSRPARVAPQHLCKYLCPVRGSTALGMLLCGAAMLVTAAARGCGVWAPLLGERWLSEPCAALRDFCPTDICAFLSSVPLASPAFCCVLPQVLLFSSDPACTVTSVGFVSICLVLIIRFRNIKSDSAQWGHGAQDSVTVCGNRLQRGLSTQPHCHASLCLSSCFPSFLELHSGNKVRGGHAGGSSAWSGVSRVQSWCCVCWGWARSEQGRMRHG